MYFTFAIFLKDFSIPSFFASRTKRTFWFANPILSIIDARRGNVFAGYYDNNLEIIKEEELTSYEEIDKNNYKIDNRIYIGSYYLSYVNVVLGIDIEII